MPMTILVARFSALGDLVTLEITFRAIRHFYPDATIVFLTSPIGKALYADMSLFDHIIVDKGQGNDAREALKALHFEIIFNLQCTMRSHWLLRGIGASRKVLSSSTWWQKLLRYKPKQRWTPELLIQSGCDKGAVDDYFRQEGAVKIRLTSQTTQVTQKLQSFRQGRKLIALAPGASERWGSKKWGDEQFFALAVSLDRQGYGIVLVGSSLEQAVGEMIVQHLPQVYNTIGSTTLQELKEVLCQVDLLVGNDSGPLHLAAGVGCNTVTIFGPTDVKHWVGGGAYDGEHAYCISEPRQSCQPCYKGVCPTQHECMRTITPQQVYETISRFAL